uniref:Gnk2-homologous domain-containing protein n=1 Tax=Kalanchoe fedtschenkoi TaxID=63787 RepID=A0A7N0ZYI2_KALFE
MLTICVMIKLIFAAVSVVAFLRLSFADDVNLSNGWSCYPRPDNSTTAAFKANLNSLLGLLEEQGPRNNGFYKTEVGERTDKLYGLVQCRGDVSAQDCAACIKDAVKEDLTECNNTRSSALWFRWCFLRYSQENFFGQWEDGMSVGISNNNATADSPAVVIKGMNLMNQLAFEAPDQPFMFKTGSVGVGKNETRYGLAQCNRDLSKSSCGKCLTSLAGIFSQQIGNTSSFSEISMGCTMLYDRYKFYFNYSLPASGGVAPTLPSHGGLQIGRYAGLQISLAAVATVLLSV